MPSQAKPDRQQTFLMKCKTDLLSPYTVQELLCHDTFIKDATGMACKALWPRLISLYIHCFHRSDRNLVLECQIVWLNELN